MLVLSAPSGTGKTTLARRLVQWVPDAIFSISVTTRAPRGREREGVDYRFVAKETFDAMRESGELLEWAEVHGACYGTPAYYAREAIDGGHLVLFDIDVQGGKQIKARHPEAVTVLVRPPSMEELERRLRKRGTESEEAIQRRLAVARSELAAGEATYDYDLVNDDLDGAFRKLQAIVRLHREIPEEGDEEIAAELSLGKKDAKKSVDNDGVGA